MNLQSLLGPAPWPRQLTTLAAFLVPALALTVSSGYSYGAVLLLIGALAALPHWATRRPDPRAAVLAVLMIGMGFFWLILAFPEGGWNQWDRPMKFFLAALCLLFVVACPPRPCAAFWGLLVGCAGAGAVAIWQVGVEGAPRASGFPSGRTNAIQWGNLAMLLGAMLASQLMAMRKELNRWVIVAGALATAAALNASVLSQSRGGWLALLLALPVGLWLVFRFNRRRLARVVCAVAAVVVIVGAANHDVLDQRWEIMTSEVQVYQAQRSANTSVGQRLEHWRFAWDLGLERPLLGWTTTGYLQEKDRRVAAGQYQPSIQEYVFVHNEVLDVFVKAGLVGVAWLLALYLWPLYLLWPTRKRVAAFADQPAAWRAQWLALRVAGCCVPVLYIGFGLTQVFFAHNSGIMGYLFLIMLQWSAVLGMERGAARPGAA